VRALIERCAAAILALAAAAPALAAPVRVPLEVDAAFIAEAIRAQLFTEPDGSARPWRSADGCSQLVLTDPAVAVRDGRLVTSARVRARGGTRVLGWCLFSFGWRGEVEAFEEPVLEADSALVRFRVLDSALSEESGSRWLPLGTVWGWVKAYVHPRLEAVTLDFGPALEELKGLLPLFLAGQDLERAARLAQSIALERVEVSGFGVTVHLRFAVEQDAPVLPARPEPALTPAELAAFEEALGRLDGFLTYSVKAAAHDGPERDFRLELLEVLVGARHDLVSALAAPEYAAPDAVRSLFLRTWTQLAPLARRLHTRLPGERALRYLTFVAAGDALRAIDELGPGSGLEISEAGLRRLARLIGPAGGDADPLAHGAELDAELRELLGFGAPLELPRLPRSRAASAVRPVGWSPAAAVAPLSDEHHELAARLNDWDPARDDLHDYLAAMAKLLRGVAATTEATEGGLAVEIAPLYSDLLLATAWQESCWRQFTRRQGRRVPIRSGIGAVGLMQVNPHVWRGFYDVAALGGDVGYNARAGAEILLHYLRDYALARGEHRVTGEVESLARAAYAAYNGGPRHLRRYRRAETPARLRRIDESFFARYRAVRTDGERAVASCFS
jgi:hypothetical protein